MAHDYIMRWLQHVKTQLHNAYITIKQIIPSSIRLKLPAPPHWALDFIPCWENGALHTVMYSPGEQRKAASLTSSRFFLTRDSAWIWIAFIFRGGLYRSTQSFHLRRVKPRCHGSHVAWPPAIFFPEHHLGIFKGTFASRVGMTYTVSPLVRNSGHPLPQVLAFTPRRITHSTKSARALTFLPEWKHSPVGFTKEKHPIHYGVFPIARPRGRFE